MVRTTFAILFNTNLDYEVIAKHIDSDGRYIILDLKVRDTRMILVNVYAPHGKSKEQVPFYEKLYKTLRYRKNCSTNLVRGKCHI